MYVKQLAYYSQTPKKSHINRFLKLQIRGEKPIFPQIRAFEHLITILADFGYGLNRDITMQDIKAYQELMDFELNPFEIRAIFSLSNDFKKTFNEALEEDFLQPYQI